MQAAPAFDQSFAQRLAKVDLTAVMTRVAQDTGLSEADLIRAEDLYRKFLTLIATNTTGRDMVPPKIADFVWHTHIMFTRQYAADCELLFGRFLHHNPREDDTTEDYQDTLDGYTAQFGIDIRNYGLSDVAFAQAGGCGGS